MPSQHTHEGNGVRAIQSGLEEHGIRHVNSVRWNLGAAQLLEHAIQSREGHLSSGGSLVVRTGQFTGRSPKDKFIVRDEITDSTVQWGSVNQPMSEAHFDRLYARMQSFWHGRDVFVQDCFVGADPAYTLPLRVISQYAWHSLFALQLFVRRGPREEARHQPEFTILFAPDFQADPANDGTNSETCIVINFKKKVVLICGTQYAGEMKKSAFTIMNYLLPERGVFPMHCSANRGESGDVALFFGLSGTGKTTLSAEPLRRLIGDDEHGWSDQGVFNFEGGCYAKCIRLSREQEPQIWNAIRFGTVLENVEMDPETRELDFNSEEITENTRAAYPLEFIENALIPSVGGPACQRGFPHRRRFRGAAAHFAADTRAGHVPLPERLHGQSGGHGARVGQRAASDFQRLFRGAVSASSGVSLRVDAGRTAAPLRVGLLAGEHRMDRRPVRGGRAHEAAIYPRHVECRAPQRTPRRGHGDGPGI